MVVAWVGEGEDADWVGALFEAVAEEALVAVVAMSVTLDWIG